MTNPSPTEKHTACYHKEEAPSLCEQCGGCLACRETRRAGSCVNGSDCQIASENDQPEPVTVAPALTGRLEGEALIARKRPSAPHDRRRALPDRPQPQ